MKKLISILLALLLLVLPAWAEEENETPVDEIPELEEGQILMHGYIDPYVKFYLGVPAEWAILGPGSTAANLTEAAEIMEDADVYGIFHSFTEDNAVLICRSADGAGVTVSYGSSDGVSNETLVNDMEQIQAELKNAYSGLSFKEGCGAYSFKSVTDILYIGMTYKNTDFYQYYLVSGAQMYLFTFFGTTLETAQTVMSTFSIV